MQPIYLDNNSTTAVLPEVIEVMSQCYHAHLANPASSHHAGRAARKAIEEAREMIGQNLGVQLQKMDADRIIFTSGATEANNLILRGLVGAKSHAIISAIEHPSVTQTCSRLVAQGWQVDLLPVDQSGIICVNQLAAMIKENTQFVSIMLANNETGAIQPVAEAAQICHQNGVMIHTDAAQAVGKIPLNFSELDVDAMTLTAHKFNGPAGIGALIVRHHVQFEPLFYGGFQQEELRPGTETPSLAVGFQKALECWQQKFDHYQAHLLELRNSLEQGLKAELPETVIHAANADRLPNTSSIAFPGIDRQQLLMALDMQKIACSTGSACASGSSDPSHVLVAMGCQEELLNSSLRFSVGINNTLEEIQQAVLRIVKVVHDLRR